MRNQEVDRSLVDTDYEDMDYYINEGRVTVIGGDKENFIYEGSPEDLLISNSGEKGEKYIEKNKNRTVRLTGINENDCVVSDDAEFID